MSAPTDYLSILTYTRDTQLFSELFYFLTAISICMWCAVAASTLARSFLRRFYIHQRTHHKKDEATES